MDILFSTRRSFFISVVGVLYLMIALNKSEFGICLFFLQLRDDKKYTASGKVV